MGGNGQIDSILASESIDADAPSVISQHRRIAHRAPASSQASERGAKSRAFGQQVNMSSSLSLFAKGVKRDRATLTVAAEVQNAEDSVEPSSASALQSAAAEEYPATKKRKISNAAGMTERSLALANEATSVAATTEDPSLLAPSQEQEGGDGEEAETAREVSTRPKRNASVKANAALEAGFFPNINFEELGVEEKKKKKSRQSEVSLAKSRAKTAEAPKLKERAFAKAQTQAQLKDRGRPLKVKEAKATKGQSDEETEGAEEISSSSALPSSSQQAGDGLVSTKAKMVIPESSTVRSDSASPEKADDGPSSSQSMATVEEEILVAQERQLASATTFSTTATSTSGTRATTVDGEDQTDKGPRAQSRTPSSKAAQKLKEIGDDVEVADGMNPKAIVDL